MTITLYNNTSESHRVKKTISQVAVLTGTVRENSSIISPTVTIQYDNVTSFNYIYITEFKRYYFVDNVEVGINHLLHLSCSVDVLMSFSNNFLNLYGIIDRQENLYNQYLIDPLMDSYVNPKIQTKLFSGAGFNDHLETLLIVQGGKNAGKDPATISEVNTDEL